MAARGKIAGKLGKNIKKAASKQEYGPYLQVLIPAGEAVAAPPLGPQLAQVIKHQISMDREVLSCRCQLES